ncbi:MAG: nitroreductase family protein [Ruminiclostridium sp.]
MDFLNLAKSRYSVRSFLSQKVEEEKLLAILEAGHVAPTAANKQPQRLIVVQEEEGLNKISKATNIYGAPLVIIVCSDRNVAWERPFDGKSMVDIDSSIITDHMMLQATDLSLGSVWITYFKPDVITQEFNLPENLEPINILAIGYKKGDSPSPDRHSTTRYPLNKTVFYENL